MFTALIYVQHLLGIGHLVRAGALARGLEAVNFRIIFQIMIYWVLTVPASAITSMIVYKIIRIFY